MTVRIYYFCGSEAFQPEILVRHAKIAEESGFDGIVLSEHFQPWTEGGGAAGFAFSVLGAIAQETKRIQLMTGVIAPLFRYHPAIVAQAAATIDRISGGRFLLGVGTGEALNEVPLGFEFPPYAERAARLQEALRIMRKLLDGERVDFQGKFYCVRDTRLYSPPARRIPIFVAAAGKKSAQLAGEEADGIVSSVKERGSASVLLECARQAAGARPFQCAVGRWTVFGATAEKRWKALGTWRGLRVPDAKTMTDPRKLQKQADSASRERILEGFLPISSMQAYRAAYGELIKDLEPDIVIVQTTTAGSQEDLIRRLGSELAPYLRSMHNGREET